MNILWLLMLAVNAVESAKILIAIPIYVKSHYISQRRLGLGLAARGHEVHVITTFTENNSPKNYHEVVVPETNDWELLGIDRPESLFELADFNFVQTRRDINDLGLAHAEFVLKSNPVQKLLSEDHKFDLVICEVFHNPALNMLAHYYQAPLVLFTTFGNSFHTNHFIRNPLQLSTVLHEYGIVEDPQSFWGRAKNVFYSVYDLFTFKYVYYPQFEQLAMTLIPNLREPVPSMQQLVSNASLVLINSHFTADGSTAYLPNVIEVGGLHVEEPKPLPVDLENILESSSEGVVLVSFGSILEVSELSSDKRDVFLKVLGKLKQKVILKWEKDELPGKPHNVMIQKWLPQRDILAHRNVKLFISHGGLTGLQEAIHFGVPILGIPIFADQFNNIIQTRKLGIAELLKFEEINEYNFEKVVLDMVSPDRYYKKAKEISKRFQDRPMSPLDTAIYWVEYVIRHKGAEFLRSPGLDMNLLKFYMLDIAIVALLLMLSFAAVLKKLFDLCKKTKPAAFSGKNKDKMS